MMDVYGFWRDVLAQDAEAIPGYFSPDALVQWHCTNEQFTLTEYVRANCEYPGDWDGAVERVYSLPNGLLTITKVWPTDKSVSFHVTSVFTLKEDKIALLEEYWADDGPAPQWRQEMEIGKPIQEAETWH